MQSSVVHTSPRAVRWLVPLAAATVFVGWLLYAPGDLLGKADAIGYAVCHRIDLRSFHIGVRAMPLCARCTGMYLGALLGLIFLGFTAPRRTGLPGRSMLVVLAAFALAFVIDGTNSYLYLIKGFGDSPLSQIPNLYVPNNTLRLLTGTGMGLVMAVILAPAFNQSFWTDWNPGPVLAGWKSLLALVGLALVMDLLVLAEIAPVLYVLALLSAATVVLILTMVYAMVILMVLRQENRYTSLRRAWLPFMAAFAVAMTQILLTDILRFAITGTWSGFTL